MSSNVVYVGRIPHGFYEEQMRAYFSQFGTIKNLRLSRNKKTGASKHYAFIEFETEEVAKIVAEAMDQYLLFNSLLQCQVLSKEKVHPTMWLGANKVFKVIPKLVKIKQYNEKVQKSLQDKKKIAKKQKKIQQKLALLEKLMNFEVKAEVKATDNSPVEVTPKTSQITKITPIQKESTSITPKSKKPKIQTEELFETPSTRRLKQANISLTPKNKSLREIQVEDPTETPSTRRLRQTPLKYSPKSPLYSTPKKTPKRK